MPSWGKWGVSLGIAIGLIALGWKYLPLLVTLHIAVCFILVIVIMLQSGSAADLAGAFGGAGSQTAFGPRGAATFLSRATTWCAIVFMMTSLALSVKRSPEAQSVIGSILEQTEKSAPAKPAAQPPVQLPVPGPGAAPPPQSAPSQPAGQPPAQAPAPKK